MDLLQAHYHKRLPPKSQGGMEIRGLESKKSENAENEKARVLPHLPPHQGREVGRLSPYEQT